MDAKMFAVALCLAFLSCATARYVNYSPEVVRRPCYDYPNCGNIHTSPQANDNGQDNIIWPDDGSYPGDTKESQVTEAPGEPGYPAGVNSNLCPNYPFCGPTPVYVKGKASDQAIWSVPATKSQPLSSPVAVYQQPSYKAPAAPTHTQYFVPARAASHNDWDGPSVQQVQQVSWTAPAVGKPHPNSLPAVTNKWSAPTAHSPATIPVAPFNYAAEGGVRYPADVDPNSCPNYPYCRV